MAEPTQEHNNNNHSWVRNLSRRLLTKAQEKILSHGPNYAIVTKEPPIGEYIAQVERVCQSLTQDEAEELRGEVKSIMKKTKPPNSNISNKNMAITSANKIYNSGNNICHKKNGNNICPYAKQQLANISQYTGITPAWW